MTMRSTFVSFLFFQTAGIAVLISGIIQPVWANDNPDASLELGVTTSMRLLQPTIGYWWGDKGIRVAGMYANSDHYAAHLSVGYKFEDTPAKQQAVNLLTSWAAGSDPGADYKYTATGFAYSVNYKGLFLKIGLAHPWKDRIGNLKHDVLIPEGYWGYIHRFR